jgi:hypothetical protein
MECAVIHTWTIPIPGRALSSSVVSLAGSRPSSSSPPFGAGGPQGVVLPSAVALGKHELSPRRSRSRSTSTARISSGTRS